LALSVVLLCLISGVASATSGLPATLGMEPAAAGPGALVEVTGLDFPAGQAVDLQIATSAGPEHLASLTVAEGGYFRQPVTLPADVRMASGLRAIAADRTTAVPPSGRVRADAAEPAPRRQHARTATRPGIAADIIVMLIIAFLIAAVGGALAYAWYQTHGALRQPGMGAGDDPIWSNAGDEPIWSPATLDASH
jgi:hypothetical protein